MVGARGGGEECAPHSLPNVEMFHCLQLRHVLLRAAALTQVT